MKKNYFAIILTLVMFIAVVPFMTAQAANGITMTQARDIALGDAGLTKDDVTFTKAKRDSLNDIPQYEFKFYYGTTEYSYKIDGGTGAITSLEKDEEYIHAADDPKETANDSYATVVPTINENISQDDALLIALADAGYSVNDITNPSIIESTTDGVPVYRVDFSAGRYQYHYCVAISAGTIIDFEIDD